MSHQGRVRSSNEDTFLCDAEAGIFIVCDGMGGAAAGEIASRLAAEEARASLLGVDASSGIAERHMRKAVKAANAAVFWRAGSDRRLEGMGTTLVMLALSGSNAIIAHVGDSRCYVWRDGVLRQLTTDHSLVEEQIRLGQMTRHQAERSSLQHVITRAVGTAPDVVPDILEVEAKACDLFLLASDGLTKEVKEEEIATILVRDKPEQAKAEALVLAANMAGGRDNITCVLVRIG